MFTRSFARTASALRPLSRAAARPLSGFAAASARTASRSSSLLLAAAAVGAAGLYALNDSQKQIDCSSCCSYDKLRKDIADAIDREDEQRKDGTSIGPTLVRLAWHASGTYSATDKTGGSNGATMRFSPECDWGANAGLKLARDFLEPLKAKYPHVSYADLWTLAGVVAIENMGGPKIPWRHGRTDATAPTTVPDGRLPAADSGSRQKDAAHIREIFGRQGFTDREIVALIGCHAVGRCHTDASGYWGPWTNAETTFSNDYFRLLLEESWTLKTSHMGKPWNGPAQYEDKTGQLMMLPADLALAKDPEFRKIVEIYAKDEKAFFTDFAAAFSKLLENGVTFAPCKRSGLFGLGFWGL